MTKSIHFLFKIFLIFAVFSCQSFAQTYPIKAAAGIHAKDSILDLDIAAIRSAYTRINTMALKPELFKFESPGCIEEGEIAYFSGSGEILKVRHSGAIGDGSWMTELYFNAGKLIFCYDKQIGGPAAGKAITTEYRLYVKADHPIRCVENKKIVQPDSKAMETINTGYKLLKAYKTRNFKAALCD